MSEALTNLNKNVSGDSNSIVVRGGVRGRGAVRGRGGRGRIRRYNGNRGGGNIGIQDIRKIKKMAKEIEDSQEVTDLDTVLKQSSLIKADIKELDETIILINKKNNDLKFADTDDGVKEIEPLVSKAKKLAIKIRADLNNLKSLSYSDEGVSRMHKNLLIGLTKSFTDILQKMGSIETSSQKPKSHYTLPQIETCYDEDNHFNTKQNVGSQQLLKRPEYTQRERDRATQGLVFAQEVHKDMQELEKSIVELHQLFVDLAAQTEAQGELLDMAQENIEKTIVRAEKAVQILDEAEKHVNSARRKFLAIILVVMLVGLLIVGAIVGAISLAVFFA